MTKPVVLALLVVLALVLSPTSGAAQSTYGTVVGAAADTSGGVLPGATVVLIEVQTAFVRTSTTDENGAYEFQNLTQGLYRVDVELGGFQKFTTEPFRVEARQAVRIDARLAVGGLTEQVVVQTVAPVINTETPTVGCSVDNRELQELPFTFRTQNTSPILAIQKIPEVQRVGQQFSLSGGLPYQTEVSVDGILTTSVRRNGIGAEGFNVFPSIESIEEIKVSSINNTAEYVQLGDITTISRPGTNALHGTAFWNYNGTDLNANPNYFNKSVAPNQSENNNPIYPRPTRARICIDMPSMPPRSRISSTCASTRISARAIPSSDASAGRTSNRPPQPRIRVWAREPTRSPTARSSSRTITPCPPTSSTRRASATPRRTRVSRLADAGST